MKAEARRILGVGEDEGGAVLCGPVDELQGHDMGYGHRSSFAFNRKRDRLMPVPRSLQLAGLALTEPDAPAAL